MPSVYAILNLFKTFQYKVIAVGPPLFVSALDYDMFSCDGGQFRAPMDRDVFCISLKCLVVFTHDQKINFLDIYNDVPNYE